AEPDQRRWFLHSRGKNPPRAMELEAARDQPHAVRQQRRGQRVAGMTLVFLAVKTEADRPVAIDTPAMRKAEGLGHGSPPCEPGPGGCSPILETATMRCETVSRSTLNQRRHPAWCTQRSANSPFGLLRMKR